MEIYEIKNKLLQLTEKIDVINQKNNTNELKVEIKKIKEDMNKDGFWDNTQKASLTSKRLNKKENDLKEIEKLNENIEEINILITDFPEELIEINNLFEEILSEIEKLELKTLLNGEYDDSNLYLEIHPGAGGVESHDFALMLLEMYKKYFIKNNFKVNEIDFNKGDVAGIKSVILEVEGYKAFGLIKGETGIHRLIRISPFDSGNRRHTSFASVKVTPLIENVNYEIDEKDLKIDTYRSSGAGGQSVNTTDSAVRITHIPTNIVVTCQNERSQIQNKDQALKILKSKLVVLEQEKIKSKSKELVGELKSNSFGSQKRTYTLHPYKLVKDNISGYESTQAEKVLQGDIEKFLYYNLVK